MGIPFSDLFHSWFSGTKYVGILMVGLDNAGKTTMLYKLKIGEIIHTIPTNGFNVETVTYRKITFNIWDVSAQQRIRSLWLYWLQNSQAVIFVLDSTDSNRFAEARDKLEALIKDDALRDAKFLVFNNKADMEHSTSSAEVAEALGLTSVKHREWCVMSCSAKTGEGLYEGLEKLHMSVSGKKAMNGEIC